ncbi:PEPxxWA-CTERM sorting domain-containing protein [Phenylobacterium sp.]|uniref:PEPxxWA-CTERM sorting domain-containing protein n=1 Tax=Phenylobacterium sp. TaxID=1871053 RepID=UPI0025F66C6F|nr:PEPxxWA-CTERM sorting domain-containing protein [Phenylobacterium sp.]
MRVTSATLLLAAASASAAALVAQPAAATTAISGDLNIVANAYTHSGPTVTSMDSQSWTSLPATLNVAANAVANAGIYEDHNERVSAFGTAQATWASANSGAVNFTNYGWNFNVKDDAPLSSGADVDYNRPGSGSDWTYAFQATANGVFQMTYNVTATGTTEGLFGWAIDFNGVSVGPDLTTSQFAGDPTTSGVVTETLTKGQFYYVALDGNPNIEGCCSREFSGSMDGAFDWQITSGGVPEPASWALMIVGFGGLGAVLRARRTLAAVAA